MTELNTDYNNTELLDQELTDDQLELVAGGSFERVMFEPVLFPARIIRWAAGGRAPYQ